MQYKEYGKGNTDTIILLHGGGLSWWNYRSEAELLQEEYHVILPVLDGHADSGRPFTSIEDNASELISFIDENCGGGVLLIGGLSLGAQILLEILSQRSDICSYALVESAAVIPSRLTNALIGPAFGSSYSLIKNRGFARMQFKSLRIREDLFEDYYRDTCRISKPDMISFMKANTSYSLKDSLSGTAAQVHILAGEKENREILRSADLIQKALPSSSLNILPDLHHGEFSLNYPQQYVRYMSEMIL